MADAAKRCPECGHDLRMYDVADPTPVRRFLPGYVAGEITLWVVAGILAALGYFGWAIAVLAASLVAWAIMRRPYAEAQNKFARYHCENCQHHFEGDTLRKITADA
jgi:rubredoxin